MLGVERRQALDGGQLGSAWCRSLNRGDSSPVASVELWIKMNG